MALRHDRLTELTAALAGLVEQTDMATVFPPALRPALPIIKTLARVDLPAELKARLLGSLRSIPERAAADPGPAERVARLLVHLAAWLTDQTDVPPDLSVGTLRLLSDSPTGSPSSAEPAPESQPSSAA